MTYFMDTERYYSDKQFLSVDLAGEEVTEKDFEKCVFRKCRLLECTFKKCHFIDCTFQLSLLSAIKFIDCSFMETVFQECKTIGIDWTKAGRNLRGLKFIRCDLSQSIFGSVKLPGLVMKECTAHEIDFTGTDCSKANFEGTDFLKSVFDKTNLTEANLKHALNYSIDFRSNTLKKCRFSLPEATSLLGGLDIILEN